MRDQPTMPAVLALLPQPAIPSQWSCWWGDAYAGVVVGLWEVCWLGKGWRWWVGVGWLLLLLLLAFVMARGCPTFDLQASPSCTAKAWGSSCNSSMDFSMID